MLYAVVRHAAPGGMICRPDPHAPSSSRRPTARFWALSHGETTPRSFLICCLSPAPKIPLTLLRRSWKWHLGEDGSRNHAGLKRVDGGTEGYLPAFVMTAAAGMGRETDLEALLRAWVKRSPPNSESLALSNFRALKGRRQFARQETRFMDGHVLVREVGAHEKGGYIYDYATTMYRKLQLVSLEDAGPARVGMQVEFGVND